MTPGFTPPRGPRSCQGLHRLRRGRWCTAEPNPIDSGLADRPASPLGRVWSTRPKFAGEAAAEKLARVQAEIGKLKSDALIVSDPHNVAWTFNFRGADVSHTPLPLAFASVPKQGRPAVYIDGRKLSNEVRDYLETLADVREPGAFSDALAGARRRAGDGTA
jgi:Xaa-Pro aminopeptidase